MNRTVKKVFMLVGLLVVIFLAWQLIFNDGGILRTGYNAAADGINGQWHKVAGDKSTLVPHWGSGAAGGSSVDADTNGKAFDIDTK